jgi:hypothetical protein
MYNIIRYSDYNRNLTNYLSWERRRGGGGRTRNEGDERGDLAKGGRISAMVGGKL